MHTSPLRLSSLLVLALVCLLPTACGSGISGTYVGGDDSMFDRIEFRSGGKVEITFMGTTKEGEFVVDGERVKITMDGETTIVTIKEDGCLDGGTMIGTLCQE